MTKNGFIPEGHDECAGKLCGMSPFDNRAFGIVPPLTWAATAAQFFVVKATGGTGGNPLQN